MVTTMLGSPERAAMLMTMMSAGMALTISIVRCRMTSTTPPA